MKTIKLIIRNLDLNKYIILDENNEVLCCEKGIFKAEGGKVITKMHYWSKSRHKKLNMNFFKAKLLQLIMKFEGIEARIREDRFRWN